MSSDFGQEASVPTEQADKPAGHTQWCIWVSGYGQFQMEGTEAEAEAMRAHKAQWERGQGRKWRADLLRESDRLTSEIVALWSNREGVPMSLLGKLRRARDAEAGASDQAILAFVPTLGWLRSQEIAQRSPFSVSAVRAALRRLKAAGLVEWSPPHYRIAKATEPSS